MSPAHRRPGGGLRRFPDFTTGSVVGAAVVVFAVVLGTASISDNSLFTHLTTGRLILAHGFPHRDPYSFTAHGRPWVVQSWFASLLYGLADKAAGPRGVRVLVAAWTTLVALGVWRLSRPARRLIPRVGVVSLPLLIGAIAWGQRPLLLSLVFFVAMMLIVQERRDPRWMVPLMWLWVNTHGSFPLALVYLALSALGGRLDGQEVSHEIRALKFAALGTLLGGINPIGPQILWFPIELLSKQKTLSLLIEWQAPAFDILWERLFLLMIIGAVALTPRLKPEVRYRSSILTAVFVVAALLGTRNIVVASLVLIPVLASELADLGSLSATRRSATNGYAVVAVSLLAVGALAAGVARPSFDFTTYPVASVDWLEAHHLLGPSHRIAALDIVGNYLELRYRGEVKVFADDRVDMFPTTLPVAEEDLLAGRPNWEATLDRYRIDLVVWQRRQPLASLLDQSTHWKQVHRDADWGVWERVEGGG